jgi:hypothetical protein
VELSPTLRAHLDVLEPYLVDPSVKEILVAGADRLHVTRGGRSEALSVELPEARIRALADRLLRALGPRTRTERGEVQAGLLPGALEVSVVGAPRGGRVPLIRVVRRPAAPPSLASLVEAGRLAEPSAAALAACIAERRSTMLVGPHGAPTAELLGALAAEWCAQGRAVALAPPGRAPAYLSEGPLLLEPEGGLEAALALGADVLLLPDPPRTLWAELLASGRPFVALLEAPDATHALRRLAALTLAGGPGLGRDAASALVLAAVSLVVEYPPPGTPALPRLGRPREAEDGLALAPLMSEPGPRARADDVQARAPSVAEPRDAEREDEPESDADGDALDDGWEPEAVELDVPAALPSREAEPGAPPREVSLTGLLFTAPQETVEGRLSPRGLVASTSTPAEVEREDHDLDPEARPALDRVRADLEDAPWPAPDAPEPRASRAAPERQATLLAAPDPAQVSPRVRAAWRALEEARRSAGPEDEALDESDLRTAFGIPLPADPFDAPDDVLDASDDALGAPHEGAPDAPELEASEGEDDSGGFENETTPVASLFKAGAPRGAAALEERPSRDRGARSRPSERPAGEAPSVRPESARPGEGARSDRPRQAGPRRGRPGP